MHFAAKRLSRVEVAPRATRERVENDEPRSNQHEFNAGRLRRSLGIKGDHVSASLVLVFFLSDEQKPESEDTEYTLYNAREGKPRAAEYRLYYKSKRVTELAREGDLVVFFRPDRRSNKLAGVIARSGTAAEKAILEALDVDPASALQQFVAREARPISAEQAETLGQISLLQEESRVATEHPLLERALTEGKPPPPKDIANAAAASIVATHGDLSPDDYLLRALDEESRLYFAIEKAVHGRQLRVLVDTGKADLDKVLAFTQSIQQARRSRRGQSLQHHFKGLLERERVPFTSQCPTENGETPDFIVPGVAAYRNRTFPAALLRMVACKSTLRERWRQVLKEAERIKEKYVLTLDEAMSGEVLEKMHNEQLRAFMPAELRSRAYPATQRIGTVGELVDCLATAVGEARRRGLLD